MNSNNMLNWHHYLFSKNFTLNAENAIFFDNLFIFPTAKLFANTLKRYFNCAKKPENPNVRSARCGQVPILLQSNRLFARRQSIDA